MSGLSPRERRLIAIAILVGVLATIWLGLVSPILSGFTARKQQRIEAAETLRRNARLIASFGVVRSQLVDYRRSGSAWAVQAASLPAATELARARVTRAVADSGGALEALRDQPGRPDLIQLQADTRIDLNGLQALARRLENDSPRAAVSMLSVAAPDTPGGQHVSPLQVRLDVSFSYVAPR